MTENNLDKLISAVGNIRRVKHGDLIMANDHNSIVDALDTLCNILQPSGISPYTYLPDLDILDHFFSPSINSVGWAKINNEYYPVEYVSYITNIRDFSISMTSENIMGWQYLVSGDIFYYMTFSDIVFSFKAENPEKYSKCCNTVFTYYDEGLSNVNSMSYNYSVVYGWYDNKGYIFILDNSVPPDEQHTFEPLTVYYSVYCELNSEDSNDWLVCKSNNNGWVAIFDRDGNELISYQSEGSPQNSPENYWINSFQNPMGYATNVAFVNILYDWVAFKYVPP